jgi:hypothetical protein
VDGCLRVIGWTAAAALVIVIALWAAVVLYLRHAENPPDLSGVARSQPVAAADHVAASATSGALRTLTPDGASWLVPGPTTVSDRCLSNGNGALIPAWTPATCMRTVTAYFFFDGSFQQHVRAWDAALRASGWSAAGDPLGPPVDYYTEDGHKPEKYQPRQLYLATSLPTSSPYSRSAQGSPAPGYSVSLVFDWAERPEVSPSWVGVVESQGLSTAVAWIEKPALSPDAVETAAFGRHQFVAVATLTVTYYHAPAPAPPTTHPAAHPDTHVACRSGSGTCD